MLINQWKDEIINGFNLSNDILAKMNTKAHKMYGAEEFDRSGIPPHNLQSSSGHRSSFEHRNSTGSSS